MTRNPGYVHINVVTELGLENRLYRLWRGPPITSGKPIVILVHGTVVPLPGLCQDPNYINNDKYGFYDLDLLLFRDFQYNVFTFEYADEAFFDFGYVNYHDLEPYAESLIDAIGNVRDCIERQHCEVGPVTIIAHSVGGLIARCAAKLASGTISKIITLDTGHLGFPVATFTQTILTAAHITMPSSIDYTREAEEGSDFIEKLNEGFNAGDPTLVSLGAADPVDISLLLPIPLPSPLKITVAGLRSTSMGQVDDSGYPTGVNYNLQFYPLHYNHVTIIQITVDNYQNHEAYQIIKQSLQ